MQASASTAINGEPPQRRNKSPSAVFRGGFFGPLTTFMNPLSSDTYVCGKALFQNTGSRQHDYCPITTYTVTAQADPGLHPADQIRSSTSTCHLMVYRDELPPLSAHHTISHLLFSLLYFWVSCTFAEQKYCDSQERNCDKLLQTAALTANTWYGEASGRGLLFPFYRQENKLLLKAKMQNGSFSITRSAAFEC